MKKKELTEKQAFSIVEKIAKDNGLNVKVSLDGSDLDILYTPEYLGQAQSLANLFSGTNPKNTQEILSDDLGIFYLVNKDTLFTANVNIHLKEDLSYEDSLEGILSDVLGGEQDTKQTKTKKGYTADDLNDWVTLLNELQVTGQKHLHFIEGEQITQVAENLQSLYNTPNAPLNKVLVTKFLEQWVSKNVSEDYFLDNFVEAAYKKLYKENNLNVGFATVLDTILKYEHYPSLLLSSVINSFETQTRVVTLVERIVGFTENPIDVWNNYLTKLNLGGELTEDVLIYVQENDLLAVEPKKVINELYNKTQKGLLEYQELSFKRSGVKDSAVEKHIINYMNNTYLGKQTHTKLKNVIELSFLIESIGSYIDWYVTLCENYTVGYAEVGLENEQEASKEPETNLQETSDNVVEEDKIEKDMFVLYLENNMKLTVSEINILLDFLYDVDPSRYYKAIQGISENTRVEIKESKKRVVDSLGLQPSASVRGRKITTKMNKFLKETYLEDTEITKSNCLKLFAKVKSENTTIIAELEEMYKQEIEVYTTENSNELTNMLDAEGVDFVVDRNGITKVLRKAETEETQTPEQIAILEEKVLASYSKELTEKVYNKSKDVITEYKKLFKQA